MEEERFFSGYCRQIDGSRMVTLELEDGRLSDVDCCYGSCLYEAACPIGKAITQALEEAK